MASMTIRNIDDRLKAKLRIQAARHGHSMEDEAREILRSALSAELQSDRASLAWSIRSRIEHLGGVDLDLPSRGSIDERVDLGI